MRSQLLRWSLLIGQKLNLLKGVRSKIRLHMRTFSIIPDPKHKIYQEIIVLDGGPNFHPPYYHYHAPDQANNLWTVYRVRFLNGNWYPNSLCYLYSLAGSTVPGIQNVLDRIDFIWKCVDF